MATTITFRDTLNKIVPPWLQHTNGVRLLYSIGIQLDAMGDSLVAGVKLRFPNLYSAETLPLLGRERRIRHGRTEVDASYATRLRRWLTDHQRRGGPYALLAQLFAHYAPNNFAINLIYRSGRRYRMDTAGNVIRDDITFDPDAEPAKWARWWLDYVWPGGLTPAVWGSGRTYGTPQPPGHVWGVNGLTYDDVIDLRIVPKEWNAAHCFGRIILRSGNGRLWNYPPRVWGAGTWSTGTSVEIDVEGT